MTTTVTTVSHYFDRSHCWGRHIGFALKKNHKVFLFSGHNMIIEFYTPGSGISELTITSLRDSIMKLHREHKEISRAEISFKQRTRLTTLEKTCEIDLFAAGNSIVAKATSKNFDHAAKKAIDDLNEIVALNLKSKSALS